MHGTDAILGVRHVRVVRGCLPKLLLRGAGAGIREGAGDDGLIDGERDGIDVLELALELDELDAPPKLPLDRLGGAIRPCASVDTVTARLFLLTSREARSRFLTTPRGTPKPADPGVITMRRGTPSGGFTVNPRPTSTVARPRTGGTGTATRSPSSRSPSRDSRSR
jgi:hypothetical protein